MKIFMKYIPMHLTIYGTRSTPRIGIRVEGDEADKADNIKLSLEFAKKLVSDYKLINDYGLRLPAHIGSEEELYPGYMEFSVKLLSQIVVGIQDAMKKDSELSIDIASVEKTFDKLIKLGYQITKEEHENLLAEFTNIQESERKTIVCRM